MSTLAWVLLIILFLVLLGGLGGGTYIQQWPYGYGFHHGGIGVIGVVLVFILILALLGYV